MGTPGISQPIPSRPVEEIKAKFKSALEEARETERYELQSRMNKVKSESEKILEDAKENVDPNINDHGLKHAQRVVDKTEKVETSFNDVSLTNQQMGRFQDQREKFELQSAACMHDVGIAQGMKEEHAVQSRKIIDSRADLFPDVQERERISGLAVLHSKEGSRSLGSDNISELERKGMLSKKEALQASILRIADALDVGKSRVERNTQGEPAHKVIDRIQGTQNEKAKSYLTHWRGHQGIINAETYNDNGRLGIRMKLDPESLRSHGSSVAFVVNDALSDVHSTIVGSNYTVDFKCADKTLAREWYRSNQGVFGEETRGIRVEFTQAYD